MDNSENELPLSGLPLEGVRVIDLTTFLSGPFATQLIADLGAEVIKVEAPDGDSSRRIPPHFLDGDSAYYLANNRNKRSIVIDLKQESERASLQRLIDTADVVIDNYRPGVLQRLGIDPIAATSGERPLIWASISGFGQSGPNRDKPAYDMIVQALSGVMSLTGEPGGPASRLGIPAGDTVAGLYAVIGILAALSDVRRGGRGRYIDVSMLDVMLAMLSYQAVYSLISGVAPGAQGARHDSIPTYRSFTASDGREFVITANTEKMWAGVCLTIGMPELQQQEAFLTDRSRLKNREELWRILEAAFAERTAAEWVEDLTANGVPCALIRNVVEALDDARESGRGMVLDIQDPDRGEFKAIDTPIRFVGEVRRRPIFPPRLGQDTEAVNSDSDG